MTEELLIKEKEFRELNEELGQKAHSLMNKINYVINTYSSNSAVSNSSKYHESIMKERTQRNAKCLNEDIVEFSVKRNSSLPHICREFSPLRSKIKLAKDEQNEATNKTNVANDTIINLFKAKIDILVNDLQTTRMEYKKKCEICKNLEFENKKYELKLHSETESLKETITKLENTIKELQCQSQALNSENLCLKKDLDKLQKNMKAMNQESNSCIMRLNRSLESNDKLKNMLKHFEVEEKELKAQIKKLEEDKRLTIHSLGKQLSEVIHVLKKQMFIVDNLKRQNVCLAAVGQLKLAKEDFSQLLDEKPETV